MREAHPTYLDERLRLLTVNAAHAIGMRNSGR